MRDRGRRLFVVLLLAAAAVVAALLVRWGLTTRERDRVLVRVLDAAGKPVPSAQVQARYAPGWRAVAGDGTVRMPMVPLRAEEAATPESVGAAIEVRAPYFARRGRAPAVVHLVEKDEWELEYRLEPHAVLRVHVPLTRFEHAEAHVATANGEPEALGGIQVARPGQPAAFRIYPDQGEVTVDLKGPAGQAWKRTVLPPVAAGSLREISMVPERSQPITGRVLPPDPAPPTLAGLVEVTEVFEDGARVAREGVVVADDGGFTVPYVAPGRFELRVVSPFLEPGDSTVASAGDFAEIPAAKARPWLEIALAGVPDEQRRRVTVRQSATDEGAWESTTPAAEMRRAGDDLYVPALPDVRRVLVQVAGTDRVPPRRGTAAIGSLEGGGVRVRVETEEAPHGTVVVRASASDAGAVVRLLPEDLRNRTVLPAIGDVTFRHVAVGPVTVRVERKGAAAPESIEAEVRGGETTTVDLPAR